MLYNKEVAYIDYYENDQKVKNIGFVKVMRKNKEITLEVSVKGLHRNDSFLCKMRTGIEGEDIGILELKEGEGSYKETFLMDQLAWEDLRELVLVFPVTANSRIAKALIRECEVQTKAIKLETLQREEAQKEEVQKEEVRKEEVPIGVENKKKLVKAVEMQTDDVITETGGYEEEKFDIEDGKLLTDKWDQLCSFYQVVVPFAQKNAGSYLSIAPKDFIILRKEYQNLVNNSFLLHGYYNYRHLILGKRSEEGQEKFYLGVPGNYYDREASVAVMFGFTAFESAQEGCADFENGTFGYYLSQVEL